MQSSISLFALVLISIIGVATGWANHTVPLTDVDFVSAAWSNALTVVMVGYNDVHGGIVRSSDAGLTWMSVFTGSSKISDIAAIGTASSYKFFVVATDGKVYLSIDNGLIFRSLANLPAELYGISVGKNGNAYAVGGSLSAGKVFLSSNATSYSVWKTISPITATPVLFTAVTSYDGTRTIVVGYTGNIYYTTNSGALSPIQMFPSISYTFYLSTTIFVYLSFESLSVSLFCSSFLIIAFLLVLDFLLLLLPLLSLLSYS